MTFNFNNLWEMKPGEAFLGFTRKKDSPHSVPYHAPAKFSGPSEKEIKINNAISKVNIEDCETPYDFFDLAIFFLFDGELGHDEIGLFEYIKLKKLLFISDCKNMSWQEAFKKNLLGF